MVNGLQYFNFQHQILFGISWIWNRGLKTQNQPVVCSNHSWGLYHG